MNPRDIREHMMVHAKGPGRMNGAEGVHIGTVDRVEGDFIKLARNDSPDGQHHWVPLSWVERVDEKAVYLSRSADEVHLETLTSPVANRGAGQPDAAGTSDDGNGGATSGGMGGMAGMGSGIGVSGSGDNSLADVNPGGANAMNPQNRTGGLGGTMDRSSGQGTFTGGGSLGATTGAGSIPPGGTSDDGNGGASGPALGEATGLGAGAGSAGLIANGTGSSGPQGEDQIDAFAGRPDVDDDTNLDSALDGRPHDGQPLRGIGGDTTGLASSGGSMLSNAEVAETGAASPMGSARTTLGRDTTGDTTDDYAANGTGNTTTDRTLMSGAGAQGGIMDDRNSATGASGNVSGENGLPGQGTRETARDAQDDQTYQNQDGGAGLTSGGVQGMDSYDNSYSGGSSAMPGKDGPMVGGSAATPLETQNTNLDPSLAGSDFDREAMGQAVESHQKDEDREK